MDLIPLVIRAIIYAIIVAGILGVAYMLFSSTKASTAVSEMTSISSGIQEMYANSNTFNGLSCVSGSSSGNCATIINNDAVPSNLISNNALGNDPWGGSITILSATVPNGGSGSGFSIEMDNVNSAGCNKIGSSLAGYETLTINGTTMYPSAGNSSQSNFVNETSVGSACGSNASSTVTAVYGPG